MRLDGWMRLWIVLTAVWGLAVTVIAYDSRPRIANARDAWVSDGLSLITQRINEKETADIKPWHIAEHEGLNTPDKTIAYFERVVRSPTPNQRLFSQELSRINFKHRERIDEIRGGWPNYIVESVFAWLAPALMILALGYSIGWILRGFKRSRSSSGEKPNA